MKKKFLALALAAVTLAPFGAVAQTGSIRESKTQKTCVPAECGNPGPGCAKGACPFDGLNITDAQKSQLQQLNASRRDARKAEAKARKADKRTCDSARVAQRRAEKRDYLAKVKEIVGPEQYVVFLENFYVNGGAQKRPGGKAMIGQGRMAKAHAMRQGDRRHGKKADRVLKAQAKAQNIQNQTASE